MSVQQDSTQSNTRRTLLGLPPELRDMIWKMVILDPSPRVCSLSPYDPGLQSVSRNGSDGLFVYDYPSLRYVCRQTSRETGPHYSANSWQTSYHEAPKRPYNPRVDVLFCDLWDLFKLVDHSESPRIKTVPMAAVQVQKAQHIAIQPEGSVDQRECKKLLRNCPQVDKISIIIAPVHFYCGTYCLRALLGSRMLPKRPLALGSVPTLEPIKLEISEAGMSEYTMRHFTKKAYAAAEQAAVEFATNAAAAARGLRRQALQPPQRAIFLEMSSLTATQEGEVWEELGPLIDPLREANERSPTVV